MELDFNLLELWLAEAGAAHELADAALLIHGEDAGCFGVGRRRRAEARAELERLGLHRPGAPRLETGEQRRRRERDELLLAGEHPGLSPDVGRRWWEAWRRYDAGAAAPPEPAGLPDGLTARALRYQRELAAGAFALPSCWPRPGQAGAAARG